jgi:hypothetical protein
MGREESTEFMLTMTISDPLVLCQIQAPMAGETADACGGPAPGPRRASVRRRVEIRGLTAGSGNPSTQRLFPRTWESGLLAVAVTQAVGSHAGWPLVCVSGSRLLPRSGLPFLALSDTSGLLMVSSQQVESRRRPSPPHWEWEDGRGRFRYNRIIAL